MKVSVGDQITEVEPGSSCGAALQKVLSGKKFKSALACKADGVMLDLAALLPDGTGLLEPVYVDSAESLELLRHSAAHVMAAAVRRLFPSIKVTIGPAIDNGFYYDFDFERPFSSEDFPAIEKEMRAIVEANEPFTRRDVSKKEAISLFEGMGESYKVEIISEIDAETVSLYTTGDFTDLCRGPHIPSTGFVKAFKLLSVAGAYWRGSEKNRMLSRIYATAFAEEKALKDYLNMIEEAKRRDHRKLGRELDLFTFSEDAAPGMPIWLPKGMLMRAILEDFWRKEHLKRGYDVVQGPQLLRVEAWQKSGHYDNYRENMYFTSIKDEDERGKLLKEDAYGIKPMNCIGHMMIYNNALHSYRELPQRYFELGVVHRHEKSGVLHGLFRVRQFTQDDAHIICTPEQLADEIAGVIKLVRDLMDLFNFNYRIAVSTRPEKSIGTDEAWELATRSLISAVEKAGLPYVINEGDGAFYGPKIDVRLLDCLGREWQCSTIQCDFTLPERFDLVYVASDGERRRPVMVHRAIMGSLERFIGVLIEHFAGAFPTWLSPVQARILTVTDAQADFARKAKEELAATGLRVEADLRNEKLGFKVREAQLAKIPFILVVGDKEVEAGGVNMRLRNGDNAGFKSLAEAVELIRRDCSEPFKKGGMSYSFS